MTQEQINESLANDILQYEELKEGIFSKMGEIGAGIGGIFSNIKKNFKDGRRNKVIDNFKNEMTKAMQADDSKVKNSIETLNQALNKRTTDLEKVKQNILKKSANDPQLQQALKAAMDQNTQDIKKFQNSLSTFQKAITPPAPQAPQATPTQAPKAPPAPKKASNKKPQAPKVAPKQPQAAPVAPQVAPTQPQATTAPKATPAPKGNKKGTKKMPKSKLFPETKKQILENSKLMLVSVNKLLKDHK
jgi:hypothetical protein